MASVTGNYRQGPGGFYDPADGSGPYTIDSTGALRLVASGSSGDLYLPGYQTFTRPVDTTPYSANTGSVTGDLMANSITAGAVAALPFAVPAIVAGRTATGAISYIELGMSAPHAATVRVHLFRTTAPTVTNGDNGALLVSNFDFDKYLGFVDVVLAPGPAGGSIGKTECSVPYSKADGDVIYLLLENFATAITPVSLELFRCRIGVERLS